MGYSIHDSETGLPLPLCLTSRYDGKEPTTSFTPAFWRCDPSSRDQRYTVVSQSGCESWYRWYEIIVIGYDNDKDIEAKITHYIKVERALEALRSAERAYNDLVR